MHQLIPCTQNILQCFHRGMMVYKFIRKKFAELPLGLPLKEQCIAQIDRLSLKEQNRGGISSKSDVIIRVCQRLTKMGQAIDGDDADDGLKLLEFVKALAMDIHEDTRVEVFTIKIRAYLLALRWAKAKNTPPTKLVSRIQLFLQQIKAAPSYESLIADYYSHIERLYLQVIRQKVRRNELSESLKLIAVCFQSFKAQIAAICSVFNVQQQKLHRLIETKLELLAQLFRLQHAVKYLSGELEPQTVTAQILPRYERITFKIPTIHFPDEKLAQQCESLWINKGTKTIKRSSFDRMTKKSSLAMPMSEVKLQCKPRHRESLQETVEYLNDFFRKRANSAVELSIDKAALINSHNNFKKSNFQKENIDILCSSHQSIDSSKQQPRMLQQLGSKRKELPQIIQPKKFKLVIEMERENKERLMMMNPFKEMMADELDLLGATRAGGSLVFFPQK